VVSKSSTWRSSREPCVSAGSGMSGIPRKRPGWEQRYPATTLIESSSQTAHASLWAMGPRPTSGGPTSFTSKDRRILCLFCSPNRGRKSDRSPQLYTITHGCGTSTIALASPRSTSRNSSPFGVSLRQRSYTPTMKIRSSGPGRPTEFTPRPLHIEPNSQAALLLPI
jgi:hypothetical protein